jgi:hypothetical protein
MTTRYKEGDILKCVNDVDTNGYLTYGGTYTFIKYASYPDDHVMVEYNGKPSSAAWRADRFEPVVVASTFPEKEKTLSMEEQFKLAKSLVGRRVYYSSNTVDIWFTAAQALIYTEDFQVGRSSKLVREEFDKTGWVVVLVGDNNEVPVGQVKESTSIVVKLNDKYEAVIDERTVVVGCQTFPHSVIAEIQAAIDTVTQKS